MKDKTVKITEQRQQKKKQQQQQQQQELERDQTRAGDNSINKRNALGDPISKGKEYMHEVLTIFVFALAMTEKR